jgi:ABC-type branched-subunit amino acid transport system ATPase component
VSMLTVSGARRSFGALRAIDGVDLEVAPHQILGLIGPNGAGKSTLFNAIAGALKLDAGRIEFAGRRIDGLPPHRIAHLGIARTFQQTRLVSRLTLRENLLLAAREQPGLSMTAAVVRRGRMRSAERRNLGVADTLLDDFALGTHRDSAAAVLSGGQRKLLELARAVMAQPKLMLLDEPTAGVNPSLANTIADAIRRIREEHGATVLVVEHRMAFLERVTDRVVVMAQGKALTTGTLDEVRRDSRVLEAYLGGAAPKAMSATGAAAGNDP